MTHLKDKHIVIIGGTSGIGLATAKLALNYGATLTLTGHREDSLSDTKKQLGKEIICHLLDIGNEQAVQAFFNEIAYLDHLATPGNILFTGPFLEFPTEKAKIGMDSKFWGQYYAAKYAAPKIRPHGSIVLFSGVAAKRPSPGSALMTSVNSAVEGLGRALAVELSPLRVNVLSPGIVDTPRWAGMDETTRTSFYQNMSNRLLVKRIGQASELAESVLFLMSNEYITGETLDVSGGHLLT